MSTFQYEDFVGKFPDRAFRRLLRSRVESTHFLAIVEPGLATRLRGEGACFADPSTIDRWYREGIADLGFPIAIFVPPSSDPDSHAPWSDRARSDDRPGSALP